MNEVGVWLEYTGESEEHKYISAASELSSTLQAAVHVYQRLSHPFELAEALLIIR